MPLPIGTWKMNVNGTELDLQIQSVQDGNLDGMFRGAAVRGFWNEASQTITFDVPTTSPEGKQVFTLFNGCLFRTPANPTPNQDIVATLTGFAEVTTPIFLPANSRRTVFGWFAQISEILRSPADKGAARMPAR